MNRREKSLLAACLIVIGIFIAVIANGEKVNKLMIVVQKKVAETIVSLSNTNKSDSISANKTDSLQAVKPVTDSLGREITEPAERTAGNDTIPADTAIHAQSAGLGKLGSLGDNSQSNKTNFESDADRTNSIISDMLKDGIITGADGLSFKIGKSEFVVNYKKQPEDIFQKYRAKYVGNRPDGDWDWYYNFDKNKYAETGQAQSPAYAIASKNYKVTASGYKMPMTAKTPVTAYHPPYGQKTDDERTKSIISDMLKDGIITSADGLSFKIGNNEFIVNYKKQPEDIHQKYRAKYVADQQNGNWEWFYNYDNDRYVDEYQSSQRYVNSQVKYNARTSYYNAHASEREKADADRTRSMINDLMKDGIISNADGLSFKIGNKEFIVNGKKQPEEIYQKYRAKYVADQNSPNWEWEHSQ